MRRLAFEVIGQSETKSAGEKKEEEKKMPSLMTARTNKEIVAKQHTSWVQGPYLPGLYFLVG